MKAIFLVVLLIAPLLLAKPILVQEQFNAFLENYGKHYTGAEYERRLRIFEENLRVAAENQKHDSSAVHGVTKFFDMSFEEFQKTMLADPLPSEVLAPNCLKHGIYQPESIKKVRIPTTFDWRQTKGVVTSVKDQASCGSCWAFSTAANIEGVFGAAGQPIADLSPQEIVDCSKGCTSEIYNNENTTVCNDGCNGGWPWSAYYDIIHAAEFGGHLVGEQDYKYTGEDGTCRKIANPKVQAKISNYTCITHDNGVSEDEVAQALITYGPLSIAINANSFFSYTKGILDVKNCDTSFVNHAILLVGYGVENNKQYWIVKNSWGTSWGEQGYIRVVRGKNMCGITEGISTANL